MCSSDLMFACGCEQSVDYSRWIFWIWWICAPLQSKTIQNSRVLGYGQLNGHVASIVSMFSKKDVSGRRKSKYLGGTKDGKPEVVSTRSFAKKNLLYLK